MDYLGEFSLITQVLESEENLRSERGRWGRRGQRAKTVLVLKMKEGGRELRSIHSV